MPGANPTAIELAQAPLVASAPAISIGVVANASVGAAATQLTATLTLAQRGCHVGALSTNTVSVFIGPSGVTAANGYELAPGEKTFVLCADVSLLWAITAATAGQSVRVLVE